MEIGRKERGGGGCGARKGQLSNQILIDLMAFSELPRKSLPDKEEKVCF